MNLNLQICNNGLSKRSLFNFSASFKFKIGQKSKISQPKVINYYLLGDFCLASFKFLPDFKFKIR
jgi:hypothetical protein